MLLKSLVFLVIAFSSFFAFALKSDGKVHQTFNESKNQYVFTVDNGFHFNLQAPCSLIEGTKKTPPVTKTEKNLTFSQPTSPTADAKVSFYVCDDAKTVCEPQAFSLIKSSIHKDTTTPKDTKAEKINSTQTKISKPTYDEDGFILNNLEASLVEAKTQKKLVLIDFTASWCPACLRLVHESFKTTDFIKISKNFILSKIDVDLESNQALLKKYNIKAFPSLLITKADGTEVDRLLDYAPGNLLAKKLTELNKNSILSMVEIEKKAKSGDLESQKTIAQNYYNSMEFEKAVLWYETANFKPIEYFSSLVNLSDENPKLHPKIDTLKIAIANFPEHYYSIDWRKQLAEELKNQKQENWKAPLEEAKKLSLKWIDNPELAKAAFLKNELVELSDLLIPETLNELADIYELLGEKESAQKYSELAVQKTLELKPNINSPTIIIYLVHYMKRSHPVTEITPWLVQLENAYPKDFTYFYRHASLLHEKNESSKALPLANKALELSYGANKLKSGLLLAKVQNGLKDKAGAIKTLQDLLGSDLVKQDTYKNSVASIKKYFDEINK